MKNERAEQLLNDLIAGRITPQEFKRLAQRPALSVIFFDDPEEDPVLVLIDGQRQEMRREEFETYRATFPDARYIAISFFE